jgi:predicted porin
MKKSLTALALAGVFASAAQAQTLEMYGIVDMGFVQERGGSAGNISKLTSGAQSGTRIGFKGTEDLGNNLKALFVLETGIAADQGGFNQNNIAFGRQSFVGLQSDMGTVTLGRQYTPYFLTMLVGDPFAAGMAGAAQNMLMPGSNIRMNDTVKYTSPVFGGGFSGEVAYGFGEVAGGIGKSQQLGAFLGYSSSPVNVRLGYLKKNNATNTDDATNYILAANWDIKVAKLFAAVTDNNEAALVPSRYNSQDYLVGVQVPFNKHTFIASYIYKDGGTGTAGNANQVALGYTYTISKRTNLYAAWGRINNDTGIALRVGNNSEIGSGDKALNLGIRHFF